MIPNYDQNPHMEEQKLTMPSQGESARNGLQHNFITGGDIVGEKKGNITV